MYYICINDKTVVSVINYKPNVPDYIIVKEIQKDDYFNIINSTHFYNIETDTIDVINKNDNQAKLKAQEILASTDWQVLRHIREKALKLPTTLSKDNYIALEQQREDAARLLST